MRRWKSSTKMTIGMVMTTAAAAIGPVGFSKVVAPWKYDIAAGTAVATPQRGEATLAPKLTLADGALDLTAPAAVVIDRYRGTTPEPGAHLLVDGQRLKVLAALRGPDTAADAGVLAPGEFGLSGRDVLVGAGEGTVLLKTVQPAGKGAMPAADRWRGRRGDAPRAALPGTETR